MLNWLSNFTDWIPGQYYVKAMVKDKLVPLPISLSTISVLKGRVYDEKEFREYLESQTVNFLNPKNSEEQCLSCVGKELYDLLFKGYTMKQWNCHPRELSPSITARIPLRFNWDERYINAKYQVMPKNGYTIMMQNILDHENIFLKTNAELDPRKIKNNRKNYTATIYTGQLDMFFEYIFGKLDYRSIKFEYKNFKMNYKQPCVQINYPNDFSYTRSVEIKHVTGQISSSTTIAYEYPISDGEPFYPIINSKNNSLLKKYVAEVQKLKNIENPIYFLGRLAEFRYYDMDQVFLKAIKLSKHIINHNK